MCCEGAGQVCEMATHICIDDPLEGVGEPVFFAHVTATSTLGLPYGPGEEIFDAGNITGRYQSQIVNLIQPTAGTLTARTGNEETNPAPFTVENHPVATVELGLSKTTLFSDDFETRAVALVRNQWGAPIKGVNVSFKDAAAVLLASATTDDNGMAKATIEARPSTMTMDGIDDTTQHGFITAEAGGETPDAPIEVIYKTPVPIDPSDAAAYPLSQALTWLELPYGKQIAGTTLSIPLKARLTPPPPAEGGPDPTPNPFVFDNATILINTDLDNYACQLNPAPGISVDTYPQGGGDCRFLLFKQSNLPALQQAQVELGHLVITLPPLAADELEEDITISGTAELLAIGYSANFGAVYDGYSSEDAQIEDRSNVDATGTLTNQRPKPQKAFVIASNPRPLAGGDLITTEAQGTLKTWALFNRNEENQYLKEVTNDATITKTFTSAELGDEIVSSGTYDVGDIPNPVVATVNATLNPQNCSIADCEAQGSAPLRLLTLQAITPSVSDTELRLIANWTHEDASPRYQEAKAKIIGVFRNEAGNTASLDITSHFPSALHPFILTENTGTLSITPEGRITATGPGSAKVGLVGFDLEEDKVLVNAISDPSVTMGKLYTVIPAHLQMNQVQPNPVPHNEEVTNWEVEVKNVLTEFEQVVPIRVMAIDSEGQGIEVTDSIETLTSQNENVIAASLADRSITAGFNGATTLETSIAHLDLPEASRRTPVVVHLDTDGVSICQQIIGTQCIPFPGNVIRIALTDTDAALGHYPLSVGFTVGLNNDGNFSDVTSEILPPNSPAILEDIDPGIATQLTIGGTTLSVAPGASPAGGTALLKANTPYGQAQILVHLMTLESIALSAEEPWSPTGSPAPKTTLKKIEDTSSYQWARLKAIGHWSDEVTTTDLLNDEDSTCYFGAGHVPVVGDGNPCLTMTNHVAFNYSLAGDNWFAEDYLLFRGINPTSLAHPGLIQFSYPGYAEPKEASLPITVTNDVAQIQAIEIQPSPGVTINSGVPTIQDLPESEVHLTLSVNYSGGDHALMVKEGYTPVSDLIRYTLPVIQENSNATSPHTGWGDREPAAPTFATLSDPTDPATLNILGQVTLLSSGWIQIPFLLNNDNDDEAFEQDPTRTSINLLPPLYDIDMGKEGEPPYPNLVGGAQPQVSKIRFNRGEGVAEKELGAFTFEIHYEPDVVHASQASFEPWVNTSYNTSVTVQRGDDLVTETGVVSFSATLKPSATFPAAANAILTLGEIRWTPAKGDPADHISHISGYILHLF